MPTSSLRSRSAQAGFTLVEVLVATGILASIIMGGLSLSNYLVGSTKYADRKNSLSGLESMILQRINDPTICKQTLGSSSGQNNLVAGADVKLVIPNMQAGPGMNESIIGAGQVLNSMKLTINTLQLRDVTKVDPTYKIGNLYLQVKDNKGFNYKEQLVAAVIFSVDTLGAIDLCHSNAMLDAESVCSAMNCHYLAANANVGLPMCNCSPVKLQQCPDAWSYPTHYAPDGTPTCKPLSSTCPAAKPYLRALSLLGDPTCDTLPPPTTSTAAAGPTSTAAPAAPLGTCNCTVATSDGQCDSGGAAHYTHPNFTADQCTTLSNSGMGAGSCTGCTFTPN